MFGRAMVAPENNLEQTEGMFSNILTIYDPENYLVDSKSPPPFTMLKVSSTPSVTT